ncbi:MAG: ParA family protein [Desulfobacteraceae bacterium]|nr:MAG: ParA family protein [Desulfobacteraceae bacterium]
MPAVITIGNLKGGVGKTTTAVNLAEAMGHLGLRTLVVDADPLGNATSVLLKDFALREEHSLFNALTAPAEEASLTQFACPGPSPLVDVVPNSVRCLEWERRAAHTPEYLFGFRRLVRHDRVLQEYDYILIDTPSNVCPMLCNSLMISDYVIIPNPVQERFALDSLSLFLRILQNARKENRKLKLLGILFTKYHEERERFSSGRERVEEPFYEQSIRVFRTAIRFDIEIQKANMRHQTCFEMNDNGNGALDHQSLSMEIEIIRSDEAARKRKIPLRRSHEQCPDRSAPERISSIPAC